MPSSTESNSEFSNSDDDNSVIHSETSPSSACDLSIQFKSFEEAVVHLNSWGAKNGYGFSKCSKHAKQGYVKCDRGGVYKGKVTQKKTKLTGSRLIGCPVKYRIDLNDSDLWQIKTLDDKHNHGPSSGKNAHPLHRRFTEEIQQVVHNQVVSGHSTRDIATFLRKNYEGIAVTSQDIANEKKKIRSENLAGRSPVQALMEELRDQFYEYDCRFEEVLDENGNKSKHISHFFWAHKGSIQLAQKYSTVFLIDCTYRTNRFKMPLLDIVGVTPFHTTFTCCLCFIKKEQEFDYTWALKKFKTIFAGLHSPKVIVTDRDQALMRSIAAIFPNTANVLCSWHVEKNVLKQCRKSFDIEDEWKEFFGKLWPAVIHAVNEEEYEKNLVILTEKLVNKPTVLSYLSDTWLIHKKKIVKAWTNKIMHLGHLATSRVEGSHASLKKYLRVSTLDLKGACDKIQLFLKNQLTQIENQHAKEKMRILHVQNQNIYLDIAGKISHYAFKLLECELDKVKKAISEKTPLDKCTCVTTTTMGIPCAHTLERYLQFNQRLQMNDINEHWWIHERISAVIPNCNPEIVLPVESSESIVPPTDNPIENLIENIRQRSQSWTAVERQEKLKTLECILTQPSPVVLDPVIYVGKGRPSGSLNRNKSLPVCSTKRDPSSWELVEFESGKKRKCGYCHQLGHNKRKCPKFQNQVSSMRVVSPSSTSNLSSSDTEKSLSCLNAERSLKCGLCGQLGHNSRTHNPKQSNRRLQCTSEELQIISSINQTKSQTAVFKSFINEVIPIISDGNCGYRAISYWLNGNENNWSAVREALQVELNGNWLHYLAIYGENECKKFQSRLDWKGKNCLNRIHKWLQMPCMGLIIANAFNRPVILLSSIQSFTIPPQFSPPSASSSPIILLYHSNHFEAAHLKSDSPLPPLYPAWRWVPDTEDLWTSHFNKKISIWQGILELEAELEKDSEIKITNLKLEAVPQLSASMEDMKKKGSNEDEDEDEDEDNLDLFLDDEYFDPDGAACLVKLPENDHYFIGMCYGDIEDDSCHVCYFTDDLVLMEKKMLLSTLVIPFKPSSKEILKTIKMVFTTYGKSHYADDISEAALEAIEQDIRGTAFNWEIPEENKEKDIENEIKWMIALRKKRRLSSEQRTFIRCVSSTGLESAILRTHPDRYRDLLEDWLDDIVGQEIKQGDKEMGLKLWEFMKPSILVETILKLDMAYLGIDYDSANQRIAKMIEKSNKLELCAVEACIDLLKRGVVFDRDITFGYLT